MKSIESRGIHTKEKNTQFSISVDLSSKGDVALVNDDVIVGYFVWYRPGKSIRKRLIICRESTVSVAWNVSDGDILRTAPQPEGNYGIAIVPIKKGSIILIGERYQIECLESQGGFCRARIRSNDKLNFKMISSDQSYMEYLERSRQSL